MSFTTVCDCEQNIKYRTHLGSLGDSQRKLSDTARVAPTVNWCMNAHCITTEPNCLVIIKPVEKWISAINALIFVIFLMPNSVHARSNVVCSVIIMQLKSHQDGMYDISFGCFVTTRIMLLHYSNALWHLISTIPQYYLLISSGTKSRYHDIWISKYVIYHDIKSIHLAWLYTVPRNIVYN